MQHFYGSDQATFSGTTPGNVTRTFTRFSQVCEDIVDARVWSGIHFRFADKEAAKMGAGRPLGQPARVPLIWRAPWRPTAPGRARGSLGERRADHAHALDDQARARR